MVSIPNCDIYIEDSKCNIVGVNSELSVVTWARDDNSRYIKTAHVQSIENTCVYIKPNLASIQWSPPTMSMEFGLPLMPSHIY